MQSFNTLKWALYNILFAPVFALLLPSFLLRMFKRGGYRARMLDRFALYPKGLFANCADNCGFVWVHAVSVGEVQVAGQLMRQWREYDKDVRFCFSTTSSTGWKMAEREITSRDVLIYNPLDFSTFVKAALATINPKAIILTESEIWPNFIRCAAKSNIPLYLINARVSDRSAPRYKKAKFLFADIFKCFTTIYAQSELDKKRLLDAGAPADKVVVTGSFKFDVAHRNVSKEDELRTWLTTSGHFPQGNKILLGGSTWPGEDVVLLDVLSSLNNVTLVLAPRHFEKADKVVENVLAAGYACFRRSTNSLIKPTSGQVRGTVFLADTTGELMGLYGIADVVFVGKSLCEHGSQNMIEPCLCGKPTIVGPYTENFRPVMSDLLEQNGICQVDNKDELKTKTVEWFTNGDGGLGERAHKAALERKGVVPRCVSEIANAVKSPIVNHPPQSFNVRSTLFKTLIFIICSFSIVALAIFFLRCNSSQQQEMVVDSSEVLEAPTSVSNTPPEIKEKKVENKYVPKAPFVRITSAYIAAINNGNPKSVLIIGDDADYESVFKGFIPHIKTISKDEPVPSDRFYDIVFICSRVGKKKQSDFSKCLSKGGVLVQVLDVTSTKASDFKDELQSFPSPSTHLWMVSQTHWILVGRQSKRRIKMSALLEFFDYEGVSTPEVEKAGCGSLQDILTSYVGSREEVMPAFDYGDLSAIVRPECFITHKFSGFNWIVADKDMDSDIVKIFNAQVRERQNIRRNIVYANVLFQKNANSDKPFEMWRKAYKSNPNDTMLKEWLYRLVVNARACELLGRMDDVLACYNIILTINPDDESVAQKYYEVLNRIDNNRATQFRKERDSIKKASNSKKGGSRYEK